MGKREVEEVGARAAEKTKMTAKIQGETNLPRKETHKKRWRQLPLPKGRLKAGRECESTRH